MFNSVGPASKQVGSIVQVLLLDYGYTDTIKTSGLRRLDNSFVLCPRQAIRCHLGNIIPAGDITKWSQTACELLISIVLNKTLHIIVKVSVDVHLQS